MGIRAMALVAALAVTVSACGDSHGNGNDNHPSPPPPSATIVDLGTVALTATNQAETFDVVVHGTSSLVIVADGGDATDIDIERLRTPSGVELITSDRHDANPLTGGVSPQEIGGSVATAIVPGPPSPLERGTDPFQVPAF